jgi:predicted metal-binding protein
MYGCSSYGKKGACPPSVPSVAECREFFSEYEYIAIIHLQKKLNKPEERNDYSRKNNARLLKLEKATFLAGYQKPFLSFMDECRKCEECPGTRSECKNLQLSRPCPEGLGVEVFAAVRKLGFPMEVLTDYGQTMNRYSFLMVE